MVDEAVDHGGSNDVVAAENLALPAEGLIGRDDQAGPLIPGGHQLEEEVGGLGLKRNVADFVNHQERIAAKPGEFGVDAPGVVSLGEPCYPFGGGGEQHPMTGLTRAYRQADRKMSLPGARRGPKTRRYRGR